MRPWPAVSLAFLAACAGPTIRVDYPAPKGPQDEALARALSQVYVLFEDPAADEDLGAFAAKLDQELGGRGGGVLAYRAASPGPDPYLKRLSPTAVLRVGLVPGPLTRTVTQREVKSKDKDGRETVRKLTSTRIAGSLSARLRLEDPAGALLAEGRADASYATEHGGGESVGAEAWRRQNSAKLLAAAAGRAAAVLPSAGRVTRSRPLFVDTESSESKQASYAGQEGRWEDASLLWARRLEEGRGGWRELWNLALAAESSKAFAEAQRLYRKARDAAGADIEAAKLPWDQILADVALGARVSSRSESAAGWFARPVAVLPFSDDTTSIDGPANLRRMTAQALEKGGYAVLPLDDVDRALRRKGYSQGGQLRKGKPADFAAWTGAALLAYGHVAEFRNIMLGALGRREVSGKLRLWDAEAKGDLHSAEAAAVTQEAASSEEEAKARLSAQLGRAFLETWMGKPLGPESALWVLRAVRGLPLRPPRK